ncbi:MAG: hypothetical protein RL630_1769 [Verrucomicrobiota bacterium]
MNPQFDTRPLSCKQRQSARVKSSYSPGSFRVGNGAESNQYHVPFVAWTLSQRAARSIARTSAPSSRSEGIRKASRSAVLYLHGTGAPNAMRSLACPARCQETWSIRTEQPFANSEKRTDCQRYPSLRLSNRFWLIMAKLNERLNEMQASNGGKITGRAWLIPIGTNAQLL